MCPFCITTMGILVAGAVSTGGLAALAVKVSRKQDGTGQPDGKDHKRAADLSS